MNDGIGGFDSVDLKITTKPPEDYFPVYGEWHIVARRCSYWRNSS